MGEYILGMDIGGTKSQACIFTMKGELVGSAMGGQGNPDNVGIDGLVSVADDTIKMACQTSGITKDEIIGAGFGIAGYDWSSQTDGFGDAIEKLRLKCDYLLVNDTVLGLIAGTSEGWGVAVVSGTGCNVRGRDNKGNEGRILGYGMEWGESAGAVEVVQCALQHIGKQWTCRGPSTRITELFLQKMNVKSISELLEGYILRKYLIDPAMAPNIFQLAREGDIVAQEIANWAGVNLGDLILGVARQLKFLDKEFEIVMLGSLFKAGDILITPMKNTILEQAPKVRFKKLKVPPVAGAVLLGFESINIHNSEIRKNVLTEIDSSSACSNTIL